MRGSAVALAVIGVVLDRDRHTAHGERQPLGDLQKPVQRVIGEDLRSGRVAASWRKRPSKPRPSAIFGLSPWHVLVLQVFFPSTLRLPFVPTHGRREALTMWGESG